MQPGGDDDCSPQAAPFDLADRRVLIVDLDHLEAVQTIEDAEEFGREGVLAGAE